MTPTALRAELERLDKEATAGEWACWDMDEFDYHVFEKARGTAQDCRKSLMAVRWGRSHEQGPHVPHQRDPGRMANFNEMVANAELVVSLRNSLPQILSALRLAEVVPTLAGEFATFITAVEAHVNEHGGGGYVLARLADARDALKQLQSAKEPPDGK